MFNVLNYVGGSTQLFLDEFPGAVAAFSVQKLSSTYEGPAVEIRRASDNATSDFYFDSNNELTGSSENTGGTSLNSWNNGTNGFCRTFYNQASSENLQQTTTSYQPQIFNSSTGIIQESATGKTAIGDITTSYTFLNTPVFSALSNISTFTYLCIWKEKVGSNGSRWPEFRLVGTDGFLNGLQIFSTVKYFTNPAINYSGQTGLIYSINAAQGVYGSTYTNKINNSYSLTNSNSGTNTAAGSFLRAGLSFTGNRADGQFSEWIIWPDTNYNLNDLINARNEYWQFY